jgi:hypothetical protein
MVVVSPGDVEGEVASLRGVIQEVNRTLALAGRNLVLEMVHWKTDVHPGFHVDGPQALIDSILRIDQADILLAIFWKRMGSAGAGGTSGTKHEIRLACDAATAGGKPHIMLYFSQAPYTPRSADETDEWSRVLRFKDEFRGSAIYAEYLPSTFKDDVRNDLLSYCFLKYPGALIPEISATAVATLIRSTSITDKLGDLTLNFRRYSAGTYNIRLFLNTEITNRITPANLTDARLNEGRGSPPIYGELVSVNGLLFRGVAIDSPHQDVRISGVRGNATRFNASHPAAFIVGTLSIQPSNETAEPITMGPALALGFVKRDFIFRVWAKGEVRLSLNLSPAVGLNSPLVTGVNAYDAEMTVYLQFCELLPEIFRTAAEEGSGADCGTSFEVNFKDIPVGVHIFVTTKNMPLAPSDSPKAVLVASELGPLGQAVSNSEIPRTKVGGFPVKEVTIHNGEGTALWEWIGRKPASTPRLDELLFGVAVSTMPGDYVLGLASVEGSLAPTTLPPVFGASADAPIPRFCRDYQTIDTFNFVL